MGNLVSALTIRLTDDVSGPAGRAASSLRTLGASGKDLSRLAGTSPDLARMVKQIEAAQAAMARIGSFRDASRGLEGARTSLRGARAEAARLAAELDRARARSEALKGVKTSSANPNAKADRASAAADVRRLERSLKGANAAATESWTAFRGQATALRAMKEGLSAAGLSVDGLRSQELALRDSINATTAALMRQGREAKATERHREARDLRRDVLGRRSAANAASIEAAAQAHAARSASRREAFGTIAAGAGVLAAHRGKEIGKKAIVSAAEFDIGVRKQRAFTDVSEDDQVGLIAQAKQIGQETQFSNLDVVKAQTKAMQGLPASFSASLKAEIAQGILANVRNYALVMEADLETSAEAIRSYLQQTGKDISTKSKALEAASVATNQLVKMAKLGGMSDEDVQQFMKYASASGTAGGLTSETLMSLAALARRGGLRGDEAGVFIRSASSKMVNPTQQGLAALNAAGINYSKYVRMPKKLETSRLEGQFQQSLGISFNDATKAKLDEVLSDPAKIGDRRQFTAAVIKAVEDLFPVTKSTGVMSAVDRNRIAKIAGLFQKHSAESVDTEGLLDEVMSSKMSLPQLNALLTDKHGGKGAITQRQWDEFKASRAEIKKAGDDPDFAKKKADLIMGGLGGSLENVKGSAENLINSLGTANAGLLKFTFDGLGKAMDALSGLPDPAKQAAAIFGTLAGAGAGLVGTYKLTTALLGNGSGVALTASATALDGSAAALTRAAVALGAKGALADGVVKAAPATAGSLTGAATAAEAGGSSLLGRAGAIAGRVAGVVAPIMILRDLGEAHRPMTPEGAPYRLDQAIDPGTWERAQRGVMEARLDPEGRRGREMMRAFKKPLERLADEKPIELHVDAAPLDALGTKADATHEKLSALGSVTVAPSISASGLDAFDARLDATIARLRQIGTLQSQISAGGLGSPQGGISSGRVRQAITDNHL